MKKKNLLKQSQIKRISGRPREGRGKSRRRQPKQMKIRKPFGRRRRKKKLDGVFEGKLKKKLGKLGKNRENHQIRKIHLVIR